MRAVATSEPIALWASSVDPPIWGVRIKFLHRCNRGMNSPRESLNPGPFDPGSFGNTSAHDELWWWSYLHHYEYLDLWSKPLDTLFHWKPYNQPSETEWNSLLAIFLVYRQNVVEVFSFGPYHQLSNPNIYLDYHNTSFDDCTTSSFHLFVVSDSLEVLWHWNPHIT